MHYYSGTIGNDATLRLAPLSDADAGKAGVDDVSGYFLCRIHSSAPNDLEVLAHVATDEAAFQLSRLLGLD